MTATFDTDLVYKIAEIIADDEQNDKVRENHLRKARRILALIEGDLPS